jgi:putative ABC transport system permease protein
MSSKREYRGSGFLRLLVRALLRLYPEGIKGMRLDMESTFFDRLRASRQAASGKGGSLLLAELWNLFWNGLLERIEAIGKLRPFTGFSDDIRYSVRALFKHRIFALSAILMLALGIGVNSAIFSINKGMASIVNRFHEPDELVFLWGVEPGWDSASVSALDYQEWQSQADAFQDMGIYQTASLYVSGDGEPRKLRAIQASSNLLPMLGLAAEIGRLHGAGDEGPSAAAVVVLTNQLWQERYDGKEDVLGRTMLLNDSPHTIIGVLPREVEFEMLWRGAGVFTPLILEPAELRWDDRFYRVIARLDSDASLAQAQAQMTAIAARLAEAQPETNAEVRARVEPFQEFFFSVEDRLAMVLLMLAVGAVLLIACVNLANLLLAKGSARQGEMAVRLAVGASRWRIVRQLLTESFLLSLLGGTIGIVLGLWGMRLLMTSFASNPFQPEEMGLDWMLLVFTFAVAVAAALAFGLTPALICSRVSLGEGVKESKTGASSSRRRKRFRSGILVAQLALTVPLVMTCIVAFLNVRALEHVDFGFAREGLLTLQVDLPTHRYPDTVRRADYYREALAAARSIPGVVTAGAGISLPMGAGSMRSYGPMVAQGRENEEGRARGPYGFATATPGYFQVFTASLQRGRFFTDKDTAGSPPVAIVNEAFARLYWPGEDPIGKQLTPVESNAGAFAESSRDPITTVGVVKDFGATFHGKPPRAEVYLPHAQQPNSSMYICARTSGDPLQLIPTVQKTLQRIDAEVPITRFRSGEMIMDEWLNESRVIAVTLGLLGVLALGLSVVGLYGMVAYSVAQRTFELGVRIILGAGSSAIHSAVMRSFLMLSGFGLVIGMLISAIMGIVMRSQLAMLHVSWIPAMLGIMALLAAVTALASYLPARRATAIDPAVAMRCE